MLKVNAIAAFSRGLFSSACYRLTAEPCEPMPRPSSMRISKSAALIGVVAALCGWMVRGVHFDAEASPVPAPATAVVMPVSVELEAPLQVEMPVPAAHSGRSTRNLFAYAEREAPVQPVVLRPSQPPAVTAPPVIPPPHVEAPPRIRFTHRFIGRFGPEHRPIAAFSRNGVIVTVRAGERIDDKFTLRTIGMESVEVETSVGGEVQTERVSFSQELR